MKPNAAGDRFVAYHADTVDVARSLPDDSVDYSVFSPPFASLYTYSNSPRDMGNVKDDAEFFAHYAFLVREQFRVLAPGRLLSIHCMLMPTSKERDGYIGLRDFRGDLIRAYQAQGFIFHSEVCIWKDPVTAMQRTHALGLLHKTILNDSAISRQGLADYVVTMRKPGVNGKPIQHWATDPHTGQTKGHAGAEEFQVDRWQRYASPVWDDINPNDTLQYRSAREHDDERHICPLQLGVIRRCLDLWSRPDDVVWSPFMGIGSEGVCALEAGRRFVGAELKKSYFEQAARNLAEAAVVKQHSLFEGAAQ
ncbi:MAG TPA: DNA methyltransferase [Gemmatimonadaceae bacterium]|nr:DNA methyltransferase [Gemmatimonadaceae bacterium]